MAYLQYSQDFDNCLMPGTANEHSGVGWLDYMKPYYLWDTPKDKQGYLDDRMGSNIRCPADDYASSYFAHDHIYPISYAINSNLIRHHLKDLSEPSSTIALFETSGSTVNLGFGSRVGQPGQESSPAGNGLDGQLYCTIDQQTHKITYATGKFGRQKIIHSQLDSEPRHIGGSNYLFADGHAKWYWPSNVSTGTNADSASSPQTGTTFGNAAGTENVNIGDQETKKYDATYSLR